MSSRPGTRDASRSERRLTPAAYWARLSAEQRIAGIGALLLIVSTIGAFTALELLEVLLALAVLLVLRARARGFKLRLPLADGTAIATAGFLSAILILIRMFERPVGQGLLALACAGIVVFGGIRENVKRSGGDQPPPPPPARPNPLDAFGEAVEEATAPDR
jgi:hypothetical protein